MWYGIVVPTYSWTSGWPIIVIIITFHFEIVIFRQAPSPDRLANVACKQAVNRQTRAVEEVGHSLKEVIGRLVSVVETLQFVKFQWASWMVWAFIVHNNKFDLNLMVARYYPGLRFLEAGTEAQCWCPSYFCELLAKRQFDLESLWHYGLFLISFYCGFNIVQLCMIIAGIGYVNIFQKLCHVSYLKSMYPFMWYSCATAEKLSLPSPDVGSCFHKEFRISKKQQLRATCSK